jgi:hypothetical protein
MTANSMRIPDRKQFGAGVVSRSNPPFDKGLEETLDSCRTMVWHPVERRGLDPRTFVRLVRVPDRIGPRADSDPRLRLQGSTQRVWSLDKHEGLRW